MNKYLIIFFLGCGYYAHSQETSPVIVKQESSFTAGTLAQARELPKEGTYEIIFKNGAAKREIEESVLLQINEKREYYHTVFIDVDANTQIKVLPFSVINSPEFKH